MSTTYIGKHQISCHECGNIFFVYPYRKDSAGYCSVGCRNRNYIGRESKNNRQIKHICSYCEKTFYVSPSSLGKFCSRKCSDKGRDSIGYWLGKTRNKETNEKISKTLTGRKVKWSKKQLKQFRKKVSGENNHSWKGGKCITGQGLRRTRVYAKWRISIFERDNYTCQVCGKKGSKLEVHHILSFSDYPKLRLDRNNGQTLCKKPCHFQLTHREESLV